MAKATNPNVPVRQNTAVAKVVTPSTLADVMPRAEIVPYTNIKELNTYDMKGWQEADDPFCPMVDFSEDAAIQPPSFFRGYFEGVRRLAMETRPGGFQDIYEFLIPGDGGKMEKVGIWSSTVLADRLTRLNPDKGAEVVIVFIGFGNAKPGQNPPKMFRVFARNPQGAKK